MVKKVTLEELATIVEQMPLGTSRSFALEQDCVRDDMPNIDDVSAYSFWYLIKPLCLYGDHRAVIFDFFGSYDNQNLEIYQVVMEPEDEGEMVVLDALHDYMAKIGESDREYVYYDDSELDEED